MTVIWCMVPEVWNATDRMFCHFGPFFALFGGGPPLTTQRIKILKKWKNCLEILSLYTGVYNINDIPSAMERVFVILDYFLPCYHSNNPRNQNFEKMEKKPRDIIILHMCTINESYHVWFLRYGVQLTKFFVILDSLLSFCPLRT